MPLIETVGSGSARAFGFNSSQIPSILITSSVSLSNFQISATIPYFSLARPDFADLKFYQGATSCSYWIERKVNSSFAIVWIKIPTISIGSNIIRITADGTTGNSSGVNTFEWFDDFSSGTYGSGKWNLASPSGFSVTNSDLPSGVNHGNFCLRGGNTNNYIYGSSTWTGNYEVHERSYSSQGATNGYTRNGFSAGRDVNLQATYLDHGTEDFYIRNNEWQAVNYTQSSGGGTQRNNWLRSKIRVFGSQAINVSNDEFGRTASIGPVNLYNNGTMTNWNAPFIGERGDRSPYSQTYVTYWDWFFIKKGTSAATDPAVSII
jgi:hypothetical protein